LKEGKTEELIMAVAIEDHEEPSDPTDDPDKNHTADAEGGADDKGDGAADE
jgi:hypothetical protein